MDFLSLDDLDIKYKGITLNIQEIELMMISNTSNIDELLEVIDKVNMFSKKDRELFDLSLEFSKLKQNVYDKYLSKLIFRNDRYLNPSLGLDKKIEFIRESGILSDSELKEFDEIVSNAWDPSLILSNLRKRFSKDRVHTIVLALNGYNPLEKSGVKYNSSIDRSNKLFNLINSDYNSITIDEECKFFNVYLPDGTYDFSKLEKCLDFCRSVGKKVRLNTILFYMDCPRGLAALDKNSSNKELVKSRLMSYVDEVTKFISSNGYEDCVRSIDVFNELLNRFRISSDTPYMYRGLSDDGSFDDNIMGGWLKHLDIDDLCDVISVARSNLPNIDFMYNDDNLVDLDKVDASIPIINEIKEYEEWNNVKLVDSIGIQMHIDNNVSYDTIVEMFKRLSVFALPIEITEFDLCMNKGVNGLSDEDICKLRESKMTEVISAIKYVIDEGICNVVGFTIWSLTDSRNFRVSLENENRANTGKAFISTFHGGYYNDDFSSKSNVLNYELGTMLAESEMIFNSLDNKHLK